jgi:hypothetical protein
MVNYGQLFPGRNETRTSAKLARVWRGTGGKSATMETRFDGGESGRYNIERKPSIRESVLCLQRRSHQKANVFPDREGGRHTEKRIVRHAFAAVCASS